MLWNSKTLPVVKLGDASQPDVERVERTLRSVTSAIDNFDFIDCYLKCSTYSKRLLVALERVDPSATINVAPFHSSLLSAGDIVVDATIPQLLNHEVMKGILVATKADLKAWVHAHPEALESSLWHQEHPSSPVDPETALRLFWGIE